MERKLQETERIRIGNRCKLMSVRRFGRRRRIFYCLLFLILGLCVLVYQPAGSSGRSSYFASAYTTKEESSSFGQSESSQPLTTTSSFDRLASSDAERTGEADYILAEPTNSPEDENLPVSTSKKRANSTKSSLPEGNNQATTEDSSIVNSTQVSSDVPANEQPTQLVRSRKSSENSRLFPGNLTASPLSLHPTELNDPGGNSTSSTSKDSQDQSKQQQQHSTLSSLDYDDFDLDYQLKLNTSAPELSSSPRPPSWSALFRAPSVFTPTNTPSNTNINETQPAVGQQSSGNSLLAPPILPALLTVKSTQLSKQELERVRPQFMLYQDNYDMNGNHNGVDQSSAFANGDLLATASGSSVSGFLPSHQNSHHLNNSATSNLMMMMINSGKYDHNLPRFVESVGTLNSSSSFPSGNENILAMRAGSSDTQRLHQIFLNANESVTGEPLAAATSSPVSVIHDMSAASSLSPTISSLLLGSSQGTAFTSSTSNSAQQQLNSSSSQKAGSSQANQWYNYPHPNLHQNPLLLHHILNKPALYAQHVGATQQQTQSIEATPEPVTRNVVSNDNNLANSTRSSSQSTTQQQVPATTTISSEKGTGLTNFRLPLGLRSEPVRMAAQVTGWPADYIAHVLAASRVSNKDDAQGMASYRSVINSPLPYGFTRTAGRQPGANGGQQQPAGLVAAPSLIQEIYAPRPLGAFNLQQQQQQVAPPLIPPNNPKELLKHLKIAQQMAASNDAQQTPGRRQISLNQQQAGSSLSDEDMSTYVSQLAALGDQQQSSSQISANNSSLNSPNDIDLIIQRLLSGEQLDAKSPASRSILEAINWYLKKPALQSVGEQNDRELLNRIKASQDTRAKQLALLEALRISKGKYPEGGGNFSSSSSLDEILAQASADSNVTSSSIGGGQQVEFSASQVPGNSAVIQQTLGDGFDEQLSNKPIPEWLERQIIHETLAPHQAAVRAAAANALLHPIRGGSFPLMATSSSTPAALQQAQALIAARRPTLIVPLHPHDPRAPPPHHALLALRPNQFRAAPTQLQGVLLSPPQRYQQPHQYLSGAPGGSLLRVTAAHPAGQLQALISSSTNHRPIAAQIGIKRPGTGSMQATENQQQLIERFPFATAPAYLIKVPTLTGGTITASGSFGAPGVRFLRPRPIVPLRLLGVPSRLRLVTTSNPSTGTPSLSSANLGHQSGAMQAAQSVYQLQALQPPQLAAHLRAAHSHLQPQHFHQLRQHQPHHHNFNSFQHPLTAQAAINSIALQVPGPPATFIARVPGQFQQPATALIEPQVGGPIHPLPSSPDLATQQAKLQLIYPAPLAGNSTASTILHHQPHQALAQQGSAIEPQLQQPISSSFNTGLQQQVTSSTAAGSALNRLQQATASLVEMTSLASLVDEMVGSDVGPSPALALVQAINNLQQQQQQQHNLNTQASSTSTSAAQPNNLQFSSAPFTLRGLLNASLWRDKQVNKARDFSAIERLVVAANTAKSRPQARLRVKYIRVPVAVYETSNSSNAIDFNDDDPNLRAVLSKNQLAELIAADEASREKGSTSGQSQTQTSSSLSGPQQSNSNQNSVPASSSNDYLFDELGSDSVPQLALSIRDLQQQQQEASGSEIDQSYLSTPSAIKLINSNKLSLEQQLDLYNAMLQASASSTVPTKAGKQLVLLGNEKKRSKKKGKKLEDHDEQDLDNDGDEESEQEDHLAQSDLPMLESLISTIFHGTPSSANQQQNLLPVSTSFFNQNPALLNSYIQGFSAATANSGSVPNFWPTRGRGSGLRAESSDHMETYLTPQSHSLNPFSRHRFNIGEVVGVLGARKIISSLLSKGRRARTSKRAVTQSSRANSRFFKPTPLPPQKFNTLASTTTTTTNSILSPTTTTEDPRISTKKPNQVAAIWLAANSAYDTQPRVTRKKQTIRKSAPSIPINLKVMSKQPVIQDKGQKETYSIPFSFNINNNTLNTNQNIVGQLYSPTTYHLETTVTTQKPMNGTNSSNSTSNYSLLPSTVAEVALVKVNHHKPPVVKI